MTGFRLTDVALAILRLHVPLAKHAKIQFGFGVTRENHESFPYAASRIFFGF